MTVVDPELQEDVLSLANFCEEALSRVAAGFELAGVALPARRFILTGSPAHDCEQVVVVFRQMYIGPPGDEADAPQRCDGPRTAVIEVHVTRCIPGPKGSRQIAPTAEALAEMARTQMIDAWLLLDLAGALDQWNGMAPGGPGVIATVEAGEPQGVFQSTVLNLTVQVP